MYHAPRRLLRAAFLTPAAPLLLVSVFRERHKHDWQQGPVIETDRSWLRHRAFPALLDCKRPIRLFQLDEQSPDGVIRCTSESYDLDECPRYFALSYMWASSVGTRDIEVNDGVIPITENLWNFLKVLQTQGDLPLLWCDQISIDQENEEEKNRQISMMLRIFGKAERVLAWICDPALGLAPYARQFTTSQYWNRMWIIQELMVANKITFYADDEQAIWSDSEEVMSSERWAYVRNAFSPIFWRISAYRKLQKAPFMELLHLFETSKCAKIHDRIYAIMSIAAESAHSQSIRVDYSMPAAELVFETLAFVNPSPRECLSTARKLAARLEVDGDDLQKWASSGDHPMHEESQTAKPHELIFDQVRAVYVQDVAHLMMRLGDHTVIIRDLQSNSSPPEDSEKPESSENKVALEFLRRGGGWESEMSFANDSTFTVRLKVNTQDFVALMYPEHAESLFLDEDSVRIRLNKSKKPAVL